MRASSFRASLVPLARSRRWFIEKVELQMQIGLTFAFS
jgi:hypothetical protein